MSKLLKIALVMGVMMTLALGFGCKGNQPCVYNELEASECYDNGGTYDYDNCRCE